MSDHVVAASDGDVRFEGSEYMFGFKLWVALDVILHPPPEFQSACFMTQRALNCCLFCGAITMLPGQPAPYR